MMDPANGLLILGWPILYRNTSLGMSQSMMWSWNILSCGWMQLRIPTFTAARMNLRELVSKCRPIKCVNLSGNEGSQRFAGLNLCAAFGIKMVHKNIFHYLSECFKSTSLISGSSPFRNKVTQIWKPNINVNLPNTSLNFIAASGLELFIEVGKSSKHNDQVSKHYPSVSRYFQSSSFSSHVLGSIFQRFAAQTRYQC